MIATKNDNTLWTWGNNVYGQLGDGTTTRSISPQQIGALTDWASVASGHIFMLALKTDGTIWSIGGSNTVGQLADGTTISKSSPIQIGALTNWISIASGGGHGAAINSSGALWMWGSNTDGQLADGTLDSKSSPIQVGSLTDWKQVSCGQLYTLALKLDGTLWSWGYNNGGQLGDATSVGKSSPVQIGSSTDWASCEAGQYHAAAIKTDGTLWTWGANNYGQLGLGSVLTANYSSPVQVGSLSNWKKVSCGYSYTTALKTDGTIWTWGFNTDGQLGDNTNVHKSSPIQVGGLNNWKNIFGCNTSVIAITDLNY